MEGWCNLLVSVCGEGFEIDFLEIYIKYRFFKFSENKVLVFCNVPLFLSHIHL